MANSIVIQIVGDDSQIKQTQKDLQAESKKSGEIISQNLGDAANGAVKEVNGSFIQLNQSINKANTQLEDLARSFRADVATALVGFSAIFSGNASKSLFAGLEGLASISAVFIGLGVALRGAESEAARFVGTASLIAGILIGGLTAGIAFAIVKIGELAYAVGTSLVQSFVKASEVFLKADRQLLIFNSTIDNYNKLTSGVTGTTESWSKQVETLASTFNVSRIELQKAGAEIVSVGSKIGLTEEQMQKLLQVSVEYAKINGKDLFQTTVNFVGALNGNAQAVQAYGVKLTEASNQTYVFKKGLTDNFTTLAENEKAQIRYNNLISQYAGIAGIAASVSESLSDQDEKLAVNIEKVNVQLGKGAALIEQNNILTLAYNKALSLLSDTTLQYAGFLGALGARILQIGGLFLSFALKIFVVISAFKILNAALASNITQTAFATSLPLFAKSFNELIASLAGTTIQINSVKNAFIALGLIARNTIFTFGGLFATAGGQAVTFGSVMANIGSRIATVFGVIRSALAVILVPLGPIIAAVTALIAVFASLRAGLKAIEERTGVFSDLLSLIMNRLKEASPIIETISRAFSSIGSAIMNLVDRGFGLFVSSLSFVIQKTLELIAIIPGAGKVLGQDFIVGIDASTRKLAGLREELSLAGYQFSQLGGAVLASSKEINKGFAEVNLEQLAELRKKLEEVGKTDLQKLGEERTQRMTLLTNALNNELLTQEQFNALALKVDQDYAMRRSELLKGKMQETTEFFRAGGSAFTLMSQGLAAEAEKMAGNTVQFFQEIGASAIKFLGGAVGNAFASFGKAIAKGENALQAFLDSFLASMGQMAIQLGTMFIAQGIAMTYAGLGNGPPLIYAGIALAAIGGVLSALGGSSGAEGVDSGMSNPFNGDNMGDRDADFLEAKPQTSIALNFNGDILDSDETPLRIVDLLKKELDRSGNSVLKVT